MLDDIERHGAQLHVQTTLSYIRHERDDGQKQRLRDIYIWLRGGALDTGNAIENDHEHYKRICEDSSKEFPDSNKWVLDKDAVKKWMNPSSLMIPPLLWMNGMPGAGMCFISRHPHLDHLMISFLLVVGRVHANTYS